VRPKTRDILRLDKASVLNEEQHWLERAIRREREFDLFMLKFMEVDITEYNKSMYQALIINKGVPLL
jgi:hypothetical protein